MSAECCWVIIASPYQVNSLVGESGGVPLLANIRRKLIKRKTDEQIQTLRYLYYKAGITLDDVARMGNESGFFCVFSRLPGRRLYLFELNIR